MLTSILTIGLSAVALQSLWNSYILRPVRVKIGEWVAGTGCPSLIYLYNCDYCKGFWMCVGGALLYSNLSLCIPSYGIVVLALYMRGCDDEESQDRQEQSSQYTQTTD
jgi:hypothetical protein